MQVHRGVKWKFTMGPMIVHNTKNQISMVYFHLNPPALLFDPQCTLIWSAKALLLDHKALFLKLEKTLNLKFQEIIYSVKRKFYSQMKKNKWT